MAPNPPSPAPFEGPPQEPGRPPDERKESAERYGPIAVERLVKDDGRALLLYSEHQRATT